VEWVVDEFLELGEREYRLEPLDYLGTRQASNNARHEDVSRAVRSG